MDPFIENTSHFHALYFRTFQILNTCTVLIMVHLILSTYHCSMHGLVTLPCITSRSLVIQRQLAIFHYVPWPWMPLNLRCTPKAMPLDMSMPVAFLKLETLLLNFTTPTKMQQRPRPLPQQRQRQQHCRTMSSLPMDAVELWSSH